MRKVSYRGKDGPEEHCIYTVDEAAEKGLEPKRNWRDAVAGEWILTNDDQVMQVLKDGRLHNGMRWIRVCTGTFRCSRDEWLTTEPRPNRYTFNGKSPCYSKVTKANDAFARLTARGMEPAVAYKATHPRAGDKHAVKRAQWLLQRKEIREVIAEELGSLMDDLGITDRFILEQFKQVAMDPENANARVSALKELAQMKGMIQKKQATMTAKFRGIPAAAMDAAQLAVQAANAPLEIPQAVSAFDGLPKPLTIDAESVEIEVAVEGGHGLFGDDD